MIVFHGNLSMNSQGRHTVLEGVNMDFRELTYVLAIAQHQSITKAAESLYVSQPTLSKFLKSLEYIFQCS